MQPDATLPQPDPIPMGQRLAELADLIRQLTPEEAAQAIARSSHMLAQLRTVETEDAIEEGSSDD